MNWICPKCGTRNSGNVECGCKNSLSCAGVIYVWNPMINRPTDGGIVIDPDVDMHDYF